MRQRIRAIALTILSISPCFAGLPAGQDPIRPPAAAVRPVTDVHYGVPVTDPYRWLEDFGSPEVLEWARAQGKAARTHLDSLPDRLSLEERLIALEGAASGPHSLQAAAGRYFYLRSEAGDEADKLYVRDGAAGRENLLYDPAGDSLSGRQAALSYFRPSFDGRLVCLGISADGSENAVLRIMDVGRRAFLDGEIDRVVFGQSVNWSADGAAIFYTRLRALSPEEPPVRRYARSGAYIHEIGTSWGEDRLILGEGRESVISLGEFDVPLLMAQPGSDRIFAAAARGVGRDLALWSCPASRLGAKDPGWKKIFGFEASLSRPILRVNSLFGLCSKDAPRFKVIGADITDPAGRWTTILPPSDMVLVALAAARDGIYVQALDGGISRLFRRSNDGTTEAVALPFQGAIRELVADPQASGALIRMSSWTRPSAWWAVDPGPKRVRELGWNIGGGHDFSLYEALEVKAAGHDGTMIPMSIIAPRDLKRGDHPAILEAYGAYGAAVTPYFNPSLLAWLERGGIWAFAHVRGGGEYGEEWHRAGMKETKPNSILDFIACAEDLVARKLTSPRRLAAVGASAGGVVIGGAVARRPDLFGAAVIDAGLFDCVRREREANAQLGTTEFGTIRTEEGFRALLAMSPYHAIKDGSPLPAVLLLTALNDPRVDPWQSFKAAARLQAASASGKPVFLRVEEKGGHGVGEARSLERAKTADVYSFLLGALDAGRAAGRR